MDQLDVPLSPTRTTWREALLVAALLGVLAAGVYTPHVLRGGWYLDDWLFVAILTDSGGLLDALDYMLGSTHRPGLAITLSLQHVIGGDGQAPYLATGVVITAAQGWLFYLVLRGLGVRQLVAGLAATIFIVLPILDATRLWLTVFHIQVAGSLYLLGMLAALCGIRADRRGSRLGWHLFAVVCYAAAILTYELAAGLVLVAPLIYLTQTSWRHVRRLLVPDYLGLFLSLAIIAPRAMDERSGNASLSFLLDRATQMVDPAGDVFRSLLPQVFTGHLGLVVFLAGALGAGAALARGDRGVASWMGIAGVSLVVAVAGLLMYLPADEYFIPRPTGLGNRTNAFAAFGAVPLLLALIVLVCAGIAELLRRRWLGPVTALIVILVTAANLTVRELRQQDPWADSWAEQQAVVSTIGHAMGDELRPRTAVVSFGHTTFILPADVSVFAYSWDLYGALRETYGVSEIVARPWDDGGQCMRAGVGWSEHTDDAYRYMERVFFVDVRTTTTLRVRSQEACERFAATFSTPS